ncbi:hypothetical protein [Nocardioides lianchengensis]|uniref:Uncharacterized protein n=1 Tax=Nocardioides lianchengensis TaxID=1045774 RepID=A0A1G6PR20_9ACTN|nr:hypothetical protein [Nocardioides lianchengensis]NYG11953.1 hypothetical protein [Nocardioides lianchengensis]SDC82692.1 hypothetical protein SAMN05421872_104121 [Nocardioides lianchengensis]
MNEMNPGSFSFGPLWWAIFLGVMALAVVAVMCLFLWQASRESTPRAAVPVRLDPALGSGQRVGQLAVDQDAADASRGGILAPAQKPIGSPA